MAKQVMINAVRQDARMLGEDLTDWFLRKKN
jgi:hypothetical protein